MGSSSAPAVIKTGAKGGVCGQQQKKIPSSLKPNEKGREGCQSDVMANKSSSATLASSGSATSKKAREGTGEHEKLTLVAAKSDKRGGGSTIGPESVQHPGTDAAEVTEVVRVDSDTRASLGGLLDALLKAEVTQDDPPSSLGSETVMAMTSLDNPYGSPVRRSKCGANSANLDSTEKAMKSTPALNLDIEKGMSSATSLPYRDAVKNILTAVGVSLGNSVDSVEASVECLDRLEESRVQASTSKTLPVSESNDKEFLSDFISPLNQICGDLSEIFLENEANLREAVFDVPIKVVTERNKARATSGKKVVVKKKNIFQ